jgi:hypothetical protein
MLIIRTLQPGRPRGTTLIELMVSTGVYAFLVLALFAIMRSGTNAWKAVEARGQAQAQVRTFDRDAIFELRRTSLASIVLFGYNSGDSYQHGIAFESAMNDADNPAVLHDPLQFWSSPVPGQPCPNIEWQRWVLYYITRPNSTEHANDYGYTCQTTGINSYTAGAYTDNICPHKWLVRKDIYLKNGANLSIRNNSDLTATGSTGQPFIEGYGSEPTLSGLYAEAGAGSLVSRVRLLAREVLAMNIAIKDGYGNTMSEAAGLIQSGPNEGHLNVANGARGIEIDMKTFRLLDAATIVNVGSGNLSGSPYTIQTNAFIYPMNP